MTTDLVAFFAMYFEDIVATLMVISEASGRRFFAAVGDQVAWLLGWIVQLYTIKLNIDTGWSTATFVLLGVVSVANFVGTYTGVFLGGRIRDNDPEKAQMRHEIARLVERVSALERSSSL